MSHRNDSRLSHWFQYIDELLVPVTLGMVTLLIVVQGITKIPIVRHAVDARAGRFIEVTPASVRENSAEKTIQLDMYVSPDTGIVHIIKVYRNSQYVFTMTSSHQTIHVHVGDILKFVGQDGSTDYITFDTDASNVIVPSSGYSIQLSPDEPEVEVGPVKALDE